MMGESGQLHTLSREPSSHVVERGDNNSYAIKGLGSTSLKLESGTKLHLNNILYVPSLKKNLLSISCLEDKGDRDAFVDGKVLVWGKDSSIEKEKAIEVHEGRLYRVITPSPQSLVHMEINPIKLRHRRCGHIHYKIMPSLSNVTKTGPEPVEPAGPKPVQIEPLNQSWLVRYQTGQLCNGIGRFSTKLASSIEPTNSTLVLFCLSLPRSA